MPSPSAPKPYTVEVQQHGFTVTLDSRDVLYAEIARVAIYKRLAQIVPVSIRLDELKVNYSLSTNLNQRYDSTGVPKTTLFHFVWDWNYDHATALFDLQRAILVDAVSDRSSGGLEEIADQASRSFYEERAERREPLWLHA